MGEKRRRGGEPDGAGAPEDATPARGAAEGDLDDDASIGNSIQMLGKYTLLDTLGRGAAGIVYHAHLAGPMGFRKQVALKTIPSRSTEQEAQIRALINEARLGGHLEHPNIVSILDFGEVEGTFYIAMEYVQGHTLRDVLRQVRRRGPMPPAMIAGIGVQICRGLSYAHNATDDKGQPLSMIHRDLKPANVMITHGGQVKLLDFGISHAATNLYSDRPGETAGTPAYMSPEQATGEALDGRSDLFSLASLIAEMITGETVFAADDAHATLHRVHKVEAGGAKAQIKGTHPQFLPVLEGAWAQNPKKRFANADRMAAALHRASRDGGQRPAGEPKIAVWLREAMRSPGGAGQGAAALGPSSASDGQPAGGLRGLLQRLDSWARGGEEELESEALDELALYSIDDSITFTQEQPRTFSVMHELRATSEREAPKDLIPPEEDEEEEESEELPPPDPVTGRVNIIDAEIDEEEETLPGPPPSPAPVEADPDAEETLVMNLVAETGDFTEVTESAEYPELNSDAFEEILDSGGFEEVLDAADSLSSSRKGAGEEFPGLTTTDEIERVLERDDVLLWIEVRPGTFWRGSDDAGAVHRDDEVQHEVTISQRFLVANVPVTQALWTAVMGGNPSEVEGRQRPVDGVSWFDAVLFCNVYSRAWGLNPAYRIDGGQVSWDRESAGFRLLTEAEWEFVAKAGGPGAFAGADDPLAVAWFAENSGGRSREVATLAPNAWGVYDTSGNGWEWVWDRYDPHPEQGSVVDPMGHWSAEQRVARGGCWSSPRDDIRTARRRSGDVMETGPDLGLRIARSLF